MDEVHDSTAWTDDAERPVSRIGEVYGRLDDSPQGAGEFESGRDGDDSGEQPPLTATVGHPPILTYT